MEPVEMTRSILFSATTLHSYPFIHYSPFFLFDKKGIYSPNLATKVRKACDISQENPPFFARDSNFTFSHTEFMRKTPEPPKLTKKPLK